MPRQKLEPAARLSGPTHPDYESVAMRNRLLATPLLADGHLDHRQRVL